MGNKLLNSFEDCAICMAIQTHIPQKENIHSWDTVSLNLFYYYLSLSSESSTIKKKMFRVFNFSTVTELILNYFCAV